MTINLNEKTINDWFINYSENKHRDNIYARSMDTCCPVCKKPVHDVEIIHNKCKAEYENSIIKFNVCDCGYHIYSDIRRCPKCFNIIKNKNGLPTIAEINKELNDAITNAKYNEKIRVEEAFKSEFGNLSTTPSTIKVKAMEDRYEKEKIINKEKTAIEAEIQIATNEINKINRMGKVSVTDGLIADIILFIFGIVGLVFISMLAKRVIKSLIKYNDYIATITYAPIILAILGGYIFIFCVMYETINKRKNYIEQYKSYKKGIKDIKNYNDKIISLRTRLENYNIESEEITNITANTDEENTELNKLIECVDDKINLYSEDIDRYRFVLEIQNRLKYRYEKVKEGSDSEVSKINNLIDEYRENIINRTELINGFRELLDYIPTIEFDRFVKTTLPENSALNEKYIIEAFNEYRTFKPILKEEITVESNDDLRTIESAFFTEVSFDVNTVDFESASTINIKAKQILSQLENILPYSLNITDRRNVSIWIYALIKASNNNKYTQSDVADMEMYIFHRVYYTEGVAYFNECDIYKAEQQRIRIEQQRKEEELRRHELEIAKYNAREAEAAARYAENCRLADEYKMREQEIARDRERQRNNDVINNLNNRLSQTESTLDRISKENEAMRRDRERNYLTASEKQKERDRATVWKNTLRYR